MNSKFNKNILSISFLALVSGQLAQAVNHIHTFKNDTPFKVEVTLWGTGYFERTESINPQEIKPIEVGIWCIWKIFAKVPTGPGYGFNTTVPIRLANRNAEKERPKDWGESNLCTSKDYTIFLQPAASAGEYDLNIEQGFSEHAIPGVQQLPTSPYPQPQPITTYPRQIPTQPIYPPITSYPQPVVPAIMYPEFQPAEMEQPKMPEEQGIVPFVPQPETNGESEEPTKTEEMTQPEELKGPWRELPGIKNAAITPEELSNVQLGAMPEHVAYAVLDLPENSSMQDVRDAYKKLALQWHPDKNQSPMANEVFKIIQSAYEQLQKADVRQNQ